MNSFDLSIEVTRGLQVMETVSLCAVKGKKSVRRVPGVELP